MVKTKNNNMASDGLNKRAQKGKCRICQRVRNTINQVKEVGEVHHGFATGYIWECIDHEDCDTAANKKLETISKESIVACIIKNALDRGRFKEYKICG